MHETTHTLILQIENQFRILAILSGQNFSQFTHRRIDTLSAVFLEAGDDLGHDSLPDLHLMSAEVTHTFWSL